MKIKISLLLAIAIVALSCNSSGKKTNNEDTGNIADSSGSLPAVIDTAPVHVITPTPYRNQLEYNNIKIIVSSPQLVISNVFTVIPSGYTKSNDSITMDCDGTIIQSEVWDLDGDKEPELLVVAQSGNNKKRIAYVFSSNNSGSLSYAGEDDFVFVENTLCHRFPLYKNGKPLNKTRQLQYKLRPGEALKQLVLVKVSEN
jgi:hypothetical protein